MNEPQATRLETILNHTADGIFLLDAERRVMYFNRACEQLSGYGAEEVIGVVCRYRGPSGTGDPPDLGASLAPPPEVFQGRTAAARTLLLRPDGQRLWRHVHFFPCHDDSGKVLCVLGVLCEQSGGAAGGSPPSPNLHTGLLKLRDRLYRRYGFDKIVAVGHAMRRLLDQVRLASQADVNLWVSGEAGTGKELVSRTIHQESVRRSAPFVPVECGLIPPELLERDLFGTSSDLGTEPLGPRPGLIRSTRGGTLFLRNLTQLPRDLQIRLTGLLRDSSTGTRLELDGEPASLRLIASDQVDPVSAMSDDRLRPDLYFALSTLCIHVPPLRERKEDLPLLAQMILEATNAAEEKQVAGISPEALEILIAYDWPGNVHELEEVTVEAHSRCRSTLIEAGDLTGRIKADWGQPQVTSPSGDHKIDLDRVLLNAERKLIELALSKARGNKSRAAELLNISRPRLYRRMTQLGIEEAQTGSKSPPSADDAAADSGAQSP